MGFATAKFARLLHYASGHQPGQPLVLKSEPIHREILLAIAEAGYQHGASSVTIHYEEPRVDYLNILHGVAIDGKMDALIPSHLRAVYADDIVKRQAAYIRVFGAENPTLLDDPRIDPAKRADFSASEWRARGSYFEAMDRQKLQYVLAAAPTPGWAKQIFPTLFAGQASTRLEKILTKIYRLDKPDPIRCWQERGRELTSRAAYLNSLGLRELHFTDVHTDFTVGLTPLSIFRGGPERTTWGTEFWPNLPTEEIYTTPDWRTVQGMVRSSASVILDGAVVRCPRFKFVDGEIVEHEAESGSQALTAFVERHPGLKRVGEIAIVPGDVLIARFDNLFYDSLFDENRGCHFALGDGYKIAIDGGPSMSASDLEELGVNACDEGHEDFVFGSDNTNLDGVDRHNRTHALLRNGRWVSKLA